MAYRLIYRLCDWLGEATGTIIQIPCTYAVGNAAEQMYFGLVKARRENKKLLIVYPYELPGRRLRFGLPNMELVDIESDYGLALNPLLHHAVRLLVTAYFAFFRLLSFPVRLVTGKHLNDYYRTPMIGTLDLWKPEPWIANFSWDIVDRYEWRKQLEQPLRVSLKKRKKMAAEAVRARMGIPEGAWFACLHVREGGFHKDQCAERNANILNYIDAIKEITSRGGWVVRLGDATMTRLPAMEHVIDYPFTEFKSALMDIYLIAECRYYIGMSSGIFDVAQLFQRPIMLTNISSWLYPFPLKRCDMGLFKHVYSKSRNRFLSIREWLDEPFEAVSFRTLGPDYVLHENSPEEIRTAVREFLGYGGQGERTEVQRQFDEIRLRNGKKLITESFISEAEWDMEHRYRLASRLDAPAGVLNTDYLQKNWERDARERPVSRLVRDLDEFTGVI